MSGVQTHRGPFPLPQQALTDWRKARGLQQAPCLPVTRLLGPFPVALPSGGSGLRCQVLLESECWDRKQGPFSVRSPSGSQEGSLRPHCGLWVFA